MDIVQKITEKAFERHDAVKLFVGNFLSYLQNLFGENNIELTPVDNNSYINGFYDGVLTIYLEGKSSLDSLKYEFGVRILIFDALLGKYTIRFILDYQLNYEMEDKASLLSRLLTTDALKKTLFIDVSSKDCSSDKFAKIGDKILHLISLKILYNLT